MQFKIDTREAFSIVTPNGPSLDANMAASLAEQLAVLSQNGSNNYLIDLSLCQTADDAALDTLSSVQEELRAEKKSFVLTGYNNAILGQFRKTGLDETLNIAPTRDEAIDIISMEIIERDLENWDDESEEA